jgi:hypothetical protein
MANFWQIKTADYYWTARELKQYLPELKHSDTEDIVSRLRGSGIFLVRKQAVKRPMWIRLTMPLGLLLIFLMLITSPIKFMITGTWGYRIEWISNWLGAMGF